MKTLKFVCTALIASLLCFSGRADAAELTIDTAYGQLAVAEDSYSDYLMWKQNDGHYVVFYNGDFTCTAITDSVATLSFPGASVVYGSDNDYVGATVTDATYEVSYNALEYYASSKEFTYTDGVNTVTFNEQGYNSIGTGNGIYAGATTVDVNVGSTVVNIVVPLSINAVINVNSVEDPLVHGDIVIQNKTKASVILSITKFASADLPFTNLIAPDELPDDLEWDLLDAENSAKYFALGIKPVDTDNDAWKRKVDNFVYTNNSFTETELGVISAESNSNLALDVHFGRTQSGNHTFKFAATFVAELE